MCPNANCRLLMKLSYSKLLQSNKLKLRLKNEKRLFSRQKPCAVKKNGKKLENKKNLQRLKLRKRLNVCGDAMRLRNLSEKKFACSMKRNSRKSARKRLASVK